MLVQGHAVNNSPTKREINFMEVIGLDSDWVHEVCSWPCRTRKDFRARKIATNQYFPWAYINQQLLFFTCAI